MIITIKAKTADEMRLAIIAEIDRRARAYGQRYILAKLKRNKVEMETRANELDNLANFLRDTKVES